MKRKLLNAFLALGMVLAFTYASAQTTNILQGTVKDNKGEPIEGAAVLVAGTTIGTITDTAGGFSIAAPEGSTKLLVKFIGYKEQEIDIATGNFNVTLLEDATNLSDVVVTALGIKREQKSLGFANQTLGGSEVSTAKEANVVNQLQGKIAGVQITGNGNIGGSSRIVIRGVKSLDNNNQPLMVVDGVIFDNSNYTNTEQERGSLGYDYGNAAQDINTDDIESINVLKGTTAAALFGNRGANGAIIITTKKGSKKEGKGKSPIGVSYTTSVMFNNVSVLPKYQNEYGAGYSDGFVPDESNPAQQRVKLEDDASWGPKMDGTPVRQWSSYYPNDPNFEKLTPFVPHPNTIKDFYRTGILANNNLSLDGGNDKGAFRLSYSNLLQNGTVENSSLKRNTVSFTGSYNLSDHVFASAGATYTATDGKGRPAVGYNSLFSNFNQWWQRNLDINELRNYQNPDGTQRAWNLIQDNDGNWKPYFWDNPFWTIYKSYETDRRDRLYGNAELGYKIVKWLTVKGRFTTDFYQELREERNAVGSASASGSLPYYHISQITFNENNYELTAAAHHLFKEVFDVSALVGVNRRDWKVANNYSETQGGLNLPNWYRLENSVDKVKIDNQLETKRINSVFASLSLGYKGMVYLDLTARNDWASSLPVQNASFIYPAATASFVFSELLKNKKYLSFGKIRGGWSKVANDAPANSVATRLEVTQSFGTVPAYIVPRTFNNPNLKPEQVFQWEAGTELNFFVDRIHLDLTYYNSVTKDNIFPVQQSGATGAGFRYTNAGTLQNQGIEFASYFIPVKTKSNFKWGVGFNIARNWNVVKELYQDDAGNDVTSFRLQSAPFAVSIEARKGMPYGQIVGTDFVYDDNGNKIVGTDGYYLLTDDVRPLGSYLPQFTGGVYTDLSYKGFTLYALFDFQKGGNVFSMSNMWGKYDGTLAVTAENGVRENGIILPGVVQTGTDDNGKPISDGTQNTTRLDAVDAYQNSLNGYFGPAKTDVYDASFVKFREARLTYSFPDKLFTKLPIRGITLGVVARNIAVLKKNVPNIDPETAATSGNLQGIEGGSKPTERSIGFTFNIKF